MAIVKARVVTESAADEYGRVSVESPGLWEPSELVSVVGGVPLNVDDYVYVDVSEGFENPLVIGRARGSKFQTNASDASAQILFESVFDDKWTVGYVKGGVFVIENSEGMTVRFAESIVFNGGELAGLVILERVLNNLNSLKDYVETMKAAVGSGLTAVGVGTAASGPTGKTVFDGAMASASIVFEDMENPDISQ